MGSWPVQELRRGWRVEDGGEMTWDEITGLVEKAAPFTAFIDPDHASFYNPAHMDEAVREYCRSTGQTVPRDRASILRTVFESLALAYRRVNENICDVSDTQSSVVHILGGGCRNQVLNQFTADATGLPVIAGPEEASAMGNILMQAEAAGLVDDRKQARAMMQDACGYVRYKPRDRKSWEDAYRRFLDVTGSGKA
jgi:rhamnulokinase